ncbi:hypothetical protein ACJJTC_016674 [Scirpophaga incertulas]
MTEKSQRGLKSETVYTTLQQPVAMAEEGNIATNWREWKSAFDYYLIATGKESTGSREKCALFMHVIGKYGREILEELDLDESILQNYEQLVLKFASYCDPARNINYERHLFFETYQNEENFDKYLSALKIKSKSCDFGLLKNSLILTQLIRGIKNNKMRENLLANPKLDLDNAISLCRAAETASRQAQQCTSGSSHAAGGSVTPALEELRTRSRATAASWSGRNQRSYGEPRINTSTPQRKCYSAVDVCARCGRRHKFNEKCWARNETCYRCSRVGHFAKMCRVQYVNDMEVAKVRDECIELDESLLCTLSVDEISSNAWYCDVFVNNYKVKFKLDSGAEVSVISLNTFKEAGFGEFLLKQSNSIIREVSQSKLPVVGYFEPLLVYGDKQCQHRVYVLDLKCSNLLGLKACRDLNLITREKYSPAELLMERSLNTRLPVASPVLMPQKINSKAFRNDRQQRINRMKEYYDRGTRNAAQLKPDQNVRMKDGNIWRKAKVLKKAEENRSYWVQVNNGGTYRRNRAHILDASDRSSLGFDDHSFHPIQYSQSNVDRRINTPHYITRSGRVVRPPARFSQ